MVNTAEMRQPETELGSSQVRRKLNLRVTFAQTIRNLDITTDVPRLEQSGFSIFQQQEKTSLHANTLLSDVSYILVFRCSGEGFCPDRAAHLSQKCHEGDRPTVRRLQGDSQEVED